MLTFIIALIALVLGYALYGWFVERQFGANPKNPVPAHSMYDGIDYIPLPTWKVYLIQFLNIAGTGPIFGAIQGILFGPAAYFWIVLGCILGGAVHDYLSGMISLRNGGQSLPELIGDNLGKVDRYVLRVITLILMVLVGAVFTTTPAGLLAELCGGESIFSSYLFWCILILVYYLLATLLPISKLIGKIYPLFGVALLIMAVGVGYGIFSNPGAMPEITDAITNHHPASPLPIFPGICITIACGAISGFHATQSPMMARCMKNEKHGRPVFYGAMITEGIIALIWAGAAFKFADSIDLSQIKFADNFSADLSTPYGKLWALMTNGGNSGANPAVVVNMICDSWLGGVGTVLAVLGVVAAPITSGDTALRSARLIVAEIFHVDQKKIAHRLLIALPIFAVSTTIMLVDFSILWRYFSWFNQLLAMFTLWAITIWMKRNGKAWIMTYVPAAFMTVVIMSYILVAPEGFQFAPSVSYAVALVILVIKTAEFYLHNIKKK